MSDIRIPLEMDTILDESRLDRAVTQEMLQEIVERIESRNPMQTGPNAVIKFPPDKPVTHITKSVPEPGVSSYLVIDVRPDNTTQLLTVQTAPTKDHPAVASLSIHDPKQGPQPVRLGQIWLDPQSNVYTASGPHHLTLLSEIQKFVNVSVGPKPTATPDIPISPQATRTPTPATV